MALYLKLFGAALVPVAISVIFCCLERGSKFGILSYWKKQIIIGIVFGLAAVFSTEFGVDIGIAVINARDASPLCAGLLFGGPAGIIAGIIGGVERWFSVYWGSGMYSRLACTISCILAGFYAAALRRFMFDNKHPYPVIGFFVALVMEVLHLSILFLTHLSDPKAAYSVVKICTFPMLLCNALGVCLAIILVNVFSRGDAAAKTRPLRSISHQVQRLMLLSVVIGYVLTTVFLYILQTNTALISANELMNINLEDVRADMKETADSRLLIRCRNITRLLEAHPEAELAPMLNLYGVSEINLIGPDGIVAGSTVDGHIGLDMSTSPRMGEFMAQTNGSDEFILEYQPSAFSDSSDPVNMKYAGCALSDGSIVVAGYDTPTFWDELFPLIEGMTNNRHVGEIGMMLIADSNGNIVSTNSQSFSGTLSFCGINIPDPPEEGVLQTASFKGNDYFWTYVTSDQFYIVAIVPYSQVMESRDEAVYVNSYMEVIIFAALFFLIYMLLKRLVVNNIRIVNSKLDQIICGDLSVTVDVRSSSEFSSLSDYINSTVSTLKDLISEAKTRIDRELALAKTIQLSALPNAKPLFSNVPQINIASFMGTAKEVGGDFYDFYMLGKDKAAVLIADVSGKGIPAAMFMMQAKTMLKNLTEEGLPVNEVFTQANARLCENNEAGMFVTAWMGIIDLNTGHMTYANAGHNPPVVMRKESGCEYLKSRPGFILAGMDDVKYRLQELDLAPGDRLYLYTDGVTEATDTNNELYGEDRLLSFLSANSTLGAEETLLAVKADIDTFVGEAEQFDDITMVMLDYLGN